MYCTNCGVELEAGMKFCYSCGAKIEKPNTEGRYHNFELECWSRILNDIHNKEVESEFDDETEMGSGSNE